MVSIKEKLAGFEAKIAEQGSELVAIKAAFDEHKADAEAKIAEATEQIAALTSISEVKDQRIEELEKAMQARDEEFVLVAAERDELKAKVELTPAVADVVPGQEPVADGGNAGVEVDHEAELAKLKTSAERIAYYRKHIENKG